MPPGTLLGKMLDAPHAPVYATAGHDTAAAVVGGPGARRRRTGATSVPARGRLMGLELDAPVINETIAGGELHQ